MKKTIHCIFCRDKTISTDEHIVPEFVGGSLIIQEVCKPCNDKIGSDFEGCQQQLKMTAFHQNKMSSPHIA